MHTTCSRHAILAAAGAVVSVSLAACYVRGRRQRDSSSHGQDPSTSYPPTPPTRHWLFGHALCLAPEEGKPRVSHDVVFYQWMEKLRSRVVMFHLPVIGRFIVVGDPDVARHIFMTKTFHKSPTYGGMIPLIGRQSLVATEGQDWAQQRRLYNPGFSPSFLSGVVDVIVKKCNRFLSKCDGDILNGRSTDMLARAVDLTSDVIAQVAFGEDWGEYDPITEGTQTLQTMRELIILVGESMTNPLRRYFDVKSMWKVWRLSSALDADMQRLVWRRLKNFQDSPRENEQKDILSLTLSLVLKERTGSDGGVKLSRNEMEGLTSQLKTFYFAGHDTTAIVIAWSFWLLTKNPDTLSCAKEEVLTNLGQQWCDAASLQDELCIPTYEALQKCVYLDAVAKEALRLFPPASTTRYATDPNATAGGFRLGNSIVHMNTYALQRDPVIWNKADSFVPDRFLGKDGDKSIASFSFVPFSKGARDCIGKYFALLEIKIALAALICRYEATVVDDEEVYTTRLTSIPRNGCRVRLSSRRDQAQDD